jgi:hypothetical protein
MSTWIADSAQKKAARVGSGAIRTSRDMRLSYLGTGRFAGGAHWTCDGTMNIPGSDMATHDMSLCDMLTQPMVPVNALSRIRRA